MSSKSGLGIQKHIGCTDKNGILFHQFDDFLLTIEKLVQIWDVNILTNRRFNLIFFVDQVCPERLVHRIAKAERHIKRRTSNGAYQEGHAVACPYTSIVTCVIVVMTLLMQLP